MAFDPSPPASIQNLLHRACHTWGLSRLDAELLLAMALGKPRSWLYAWPEHIPGPAIQETFIQLTQQRAAGKPLAYLTGHKEFYGLDLQLSPDALIPRPDTETLVDTAIEIIDRHKARRILDLGTGSGAIALAIKSQCPACDVWASDVSSQALGVARNNAKRLGLSVHFCQGCWFDAIPMNCGPFDLIVSNPPYIAPDDGHLEALSHEPRHALVAHNHGLADLFEIIDQTPKYLADGGFVWLEHGHTQGAAVRERFHERGYQAIESRHDLAGLERITGARLYP